MVRSHPALHAAYFHVFLTCFSDLASSNIRKTFLIVFWISSVLIACMPTWTYDAILAFNTRISRLSFHQAALLTNFNQPILMARRWAGQWDLDAIRALQPNIARCMLAALLRHGKRPLPSCWPVPAANAYGCSPDEHHGMGSSSWRGSRLNAKFQPHASSGYWSSLLHSTLGSGGVLCVLAASSLAYIFCLFVCLLIWLISYLCFCLCNWPTKWFIKWNKTVA